MPTATIQVAGVTSPNQWILNLGANKVVAVNAPDDDDATSIYSITTNHDQRYSLAVFTFPPSSTVNSVSVRSRVFNNHAANPGLYNVSLWQAAASSVSADRVLPPRTWLTFVDTLPRPSGGTWTVADLTSLQVQITNRVALVTVCTSLWLIVDYTPPPGMFLVFP